MGTPLTATQQEIAAAYCPDLLNQLEDLKHRMRIGVKRIKRGPVEKRQPQAEEEWVLKARREIVAELMQEWCEEFGNFMQSYRSENP